MGCVMGTLRPLVLYPYFTPNPRNKESRPVPRQQIDYDSSPFKYQYIG